MREPTASAPALNRLLTAVKAPACDGGHAQADDLVRYPFCRLHPRAADVCGVVRQRHPRGGCGVGVLQRGVEQEAAGQSAAAEE